MEGTWEFSVLVDPSARILEIRGEGTQLSTGKLVGESFVKLLVLEDRSEFYRYFSGITSRVNMGTPVLRMNVPEVGQKTFVVESYPGQAANTYWLLFDEAKLDRLEAIAEREKVPVGLITSDTHLLHLIEMVSAEARSARDLTIIAVAALQQRQNIAHLDPGAVESLEGEIERSIQKFAVEGMAAKSAPGRYSVLHETDIRADQIQTEIETIGARHGIDRQKLGASLQSHRVEPGAKARDLVGFLRHTSEIVRQDAENFESSATTRDRAMFLGMGLVAILIGVLVGTYLAIR